MTPMTPMTPMTSMTPMTPTTALVDADQLHAELQEVLPLRPVVLDVQFELGGRPGHELHAAGHLPGAAHLDLDTALAGPPGDGGRHPLPDPDVLQAALREAGVDDDVRVVVYDQATSLAAARAWWVLRWAGLDDVRVLDGGLAAWQAEGHELSTEAVLRPPGLVTVRPGSLPVLDADDAARVARDGVLLDARTPERYRGESEPIDPVAGHVPGAVDVPMGDLLQPDGRLRDPAELRARFAAAGVEPHGGDGEGVTAVGAYCGSGITAAHTVLALHEAGIDAAPYIGSWSEWITDPSRPVATGADPG